MPVYTKLFIIFFLCVFFAFYFILYLFRKNVRQGTFFSNAMLFLASVVFYAWDDIRFVVVLLALGLITYVSGVVLGYSKNWKIDGIDKAVYVIFGILELGPIVLARFIGLYYSFGMSSGYFMSNARTIIIPVGLSFFTLQAFTYTDAVFRGTITTDKNLLNILTYVCFFPCVSSGPIQRAEKLLPQIQGESRVFNYEHVTDGFRLIAWGLAKKLVIADNLAIYVQNVTGADSQFGSALLLSAIFYSFQLYLDFSGYSDIVIGAAKALGFDIGKNFDHPYMSKTIGEFWRRWHISLSSWLRDYVYIPIGGSRVASWKIYRNLLITFIVSGLWHGAGATWIVWGLYHGVWLCIERIVGKSRNIITHNIKAYDFLRRIGTFFIVTFGWIIFSSSSLGDCWSRVKSFARIPGELLAVFAGSIGDGNLVSSIKTIFMINGDAHVGTAITGLIVFGIISHYTYNTSITGLEVIRRQNVLVRWGAYFALIMAILLFGAANSAEFIYNRF